MIYYVLCVIASFVIALSFVTKKKYQVTAKKGYAAAFAFIAGYSAVAALILLAISGFKFQFSLTVFFIALAQATFITAAQAVGFFALLYGDLLQITMFVTVGATVIPCVMGMALPLFGEKFSYFKILGTLLLVAALCIPVIFAKGGNVKNKVRYYIFCALMFVINGSSPLFGKLKTVIANDVSDSMFQFYVMLAVCFYSLVLAAIFSIKEKSTAVTEARKSSKLSWMYVVLYAFFLCIGDYLSLVALGGIGVSLQSPITMGLSVIFTAFAGYIFFKERISKATAISIVITTAGLAIIAL